MGLESTKATLKTLVDARFPGSVDTHNDPVTRADFRKVIHDVIDSVVTLQDTDEMTVPIRLDMNTGITAFATGGQGSATALTGQMNNVTTCASEFDSVALPAAASGQATLVKNSGAAICSVFPATGDSINAMAVNLSIDIPVGGAKWFYPISAVVWETQEVLITTAPTTQTGSFGIKATDNAANHDVLVTNASHGQTSVHTIPDPGGATGTVVIEEIANTFDVAQLLDVDVVAAAGSSSSDATTLTGQVNAITGADNAKGVALPAAADGEARLVINTVLDKYLPVYPVDSGNDLINAQAEDIPFILGPGKQAWFVATSATQWYADPSAALSPISRNAVQFKIFDDFTDAAIDTTDHWIVFEGSDGDATVAATVTAPEGKVDMGSGGTGAADDKTVMSLILLAKGALISLGTTVFECRVSFDQITGTSWGFGLGDVLANATEIPNYKVNSGTVTDDAGIANAISFVFSTDATTAQWQACSTNGSTVGNSAAEEALTDAPAANTYQVLRIEIDADGDARFYIDGVLRASRTTAVATTALLIPYIWGDSADDADVATDVSIDYVLFEGTRPSSNA